MPTEESPDLYLASQGLGVSWLAERLCADGSIGPVEQGNYYYRVPWALAVAGRPYEAVRSLDWIRRHMFSVEGEFRGEYPVGPMERRGYPYGLGCLIYGAHLLRQYDISFRAATFLAQLQDLQSGGLYASRDFRGPADEQHIYFTAQAGLSFLLTGRLAEAEKVARFLQMMYERQPDLPHRFFMAYSEEKGLLVEDLDRLLCPWPELYMLISQEPRQAYSNLAIAVPFLAHLYQATGRSEYLELAERYMAFSMGCTGRQFGVVQVCKTGWAAAVLYGITRRAEYLAWARRVAGALVNLQQPDGHWEQSRHFQATPNLPSQIDVTAEMVAHLDAILSGLALQP